MDKNTGLVLEGGAMRGLFTAGVIDVMMENGIDFPVVTGVSAGAAFGCNYKSKQPGRVLRYNLKYCREPKYCSFRSLLKTGDIFGAEFCYHTIPDKLDYFDRETFADNPQRFFVVCSDVETGRPYYRELTRVDDESLDWIRASASMPLVSRVVEINGKRFLDGGVTDSIPLRFGEGHCPRNIVVLTQPRDYTKKPVSGGMKLLLKLGMHKYPKALETMLARSEMYNRQMQEIKKREAEGSVLVIRPYEDLNISRTERDPAELERVCRIGRQVGADRIAEVKEFLGE